MQVQRIIKQLTYIVMFFGLCACASTQRLLDTNSASLISLHHCYRYIHTINDIDAKQFRNSIGGEYIIPEGLTKLHIKYKYYPVTNYKGCAKELTLSFMAETGKKYAVFEFANIISIDEIQNRREKIARFSYGPTGEVIKLAKVNPLSNYTDDSPYINTTMDLAEFGKNPTSVGSIAKQFIPFATKFLGTDIMLVNGYSPIVIPAQGYTKTILASGENTLRLKMARSFHQPFVAFISFDARPKNSYKLRFKDEEKDDEGRRWTILELTEETQAGEKKKIIYKCQFFTARQNIGPDICIKDI